MGDFKPSGTFVTRVMNDIRAYEEDTGIQAGRVKAFVLSRPVLSILSAAGILLGIFNVVRMALILLSPALCL